MASRCALWARVSKDEQESGNQLGELRAEAVRRGLDVTAEYVLDGASAWKGEHRELLRQALGDARTGRYDVLLVWALDRLSREGIEVTLRIMRQFADRGVAVWSLRESWTETSDPHVRELIAAIMAWVARMESERRSERVRAGLARRKAAGLPVGRQPGSKDRRQRKRSAMWPAGSENGQSQPESSANRSRNSWLIAGVSTRKLIWVPLTGTGQVAIVRSLIGRQLAGTGVADGLGGTGAAGGADGGCCGFYGCVGGGEARVAHLLGRGDPERERLAGQRLDQARDQLVAAPGQQVEQVRADLVAVWRTRLADLLEEDPAVAGDLQALVDQVQAELPAGSISAGDHSIVAGGDVNITGSGGVTAGIIHGDVPPPNPTRPGSAGG